MFKLSVFKHGRIDVHRVPVSRQTPGAGVQTRPAATAQLAQELRKLGARRHRQAEFAQPAAQRTGRGGGLLRQRRQGKAGIAGNAANPRQRRHGQQFTLLAQQIRRAGQTLGAGRPARRQPRQNLVAQKSAIVADIRVTGIAHQRQIMGAVVVLQRRARQRQKRPNQARAAQRPFPGHARQALGPGAAQQAQEHGFGLVVAMLAQQQHITMAEFALEARIARLARRRFQTLSAIVDAHTQRAQRHPPGPAAALAVPRPKRRLGQQSVIDMQRRNLFRPQRRSRVQQRRGVGAAAVGHDQARPGEIGGHGGAQRAENGVAGRWRGAGGARGMLRVSQHSTPQG